MCLPPPVADIDAVSRAGTPPAGSVVSAGALPDSGGTSHSC